MYRLIYTYVCLNFTTSYAYIAKDTEEQLTTITCPIYYYIYINLYFPSFSMHSKS